MGTTNNTGESKTFLTNSSPYLTEQLEDPRKNSYTLGNEILLRRYKENGDPKLPDYLIIKNGEMSEVILRHAAYFNLPIINIEFKYYKEKEAVSLTSTLESIDENSSYKDIKLTLDKFNSSFLLSSMGQDETGRGDYMDQHPTNVGDNVSTEFGQKLRSFLKLEFVKRMEFMKNSLREEIDVINSATSSGKRYYAFSNEKIIEIRKLTLDEDYVGGDTLHYLEIAIKTELGSNSMRSKIYDGDNPAPGKTLWDGANSRYYNELSPLVDAYLFALQANKNHFIS